MNTVLRHFLLTGIAAALSSTALAKLPEPSAEAKAASAAVAAKAAWTNKVGAYMLCKAQDRVVAHYLELARVAGKDLKAPDANASASCTDPGPFQVAEAKPIEAAGAHSPAAIATSPPSTLQPDATANPVKKP